MLKSILIGAAAIMTIGVTSLSAQPMPPRDPDSYYSQNDRSGFYDRDGHYQRFFDRRDRRDRFDNNDRRFDNGPPPQGNYYQEGRYEQSCRTNNNQVAGTIFGALAGGLIGGAASRGNGGAVVGGAVLGGLLGNVVSRDMDCDSQPVAFRTYATGLNGDLNRRYEWNHGQYRGTFTPIREYRRGNVVCREYTETTYRPGGQSFTRSGSACRRQDGNWDFD